MRARAFLLALAGLLVVLAAGCSPDRWVHVATGEYTLAESTATTGAGLEIERVRVDRDNQTVWFVHTDGSQVITRFSALPKKEWPAGCPTNVQSTRMEVLRLEAQTLTIASAKFQRPVLVRNCPRDPVEVVLRSSGEIGGSGTACDGAADCVRFGPVSAAQALPRSMKGYELYSWYVEEEGIWYYALVTGTNRLKSFAEISTLENAVTDLGIVKITVEGEAPLKSALSLLPKGETVIWDDAGELDGAPAGDNVLPDQDVVREIARLCQRRGIDLHRVD